ncbi:MAG: hypothetical protein RL346_2129 [Verrucomicrobiota bacterium]|jgi:hypothetical protein
MSAKKKSKAISTNPDEKIWTGAEAAFIKLNGHISTILPPATKPKKSRKNKDLIFEDAVLLFDYASRKKKVDIEDLEMIVAGLINRDPEVFSTLAKAAIHLRELEKKRSVYAAHVSTMIFIAADYLKKNGKKPTKNHLIKKTHKILDAVGRKPFPIDSPQLWTPIISAAGFTNYDKALSKGTRKNHDGLQGGVRKKR